MFDKRSAWRATATGGAAVEDDDHSSWRPQAAAIDPITARRQTRRIRGGMPPFKAACCYRPVCGFRYADETRSL